MIEFTDGHGPSYLSDMSETVQDDDVIITPSPLSVTAALSHITSPSCGGNAIFCGTTRNSFHDKTVLHLEYEAYSSMAIREIRRICVALCGVYPGVERWYVAHRIGKVAVGEVSIIVAASSAHRVDCTKFVEEATNRIKESVPIWKKEWYEDGSVWKENSECGACHGNPR